MLDSIILNSDDFKVLVEQQDLNKLVEWWHVINGWSWPAELPPILSKEQRYKEESSEEHRAWAIMEWIEVRVGMWAILRAHNVGVRMTSEEFEDFYDGTHRNNEEARARHETRVQEKISRLVFHGASMAGRPAYRTGRQNVPGG